MFPHQTTGHLSTPTCKIRHCLTASHDQMRWFHFHHGTWEHQQILQDSNTRSLKWSALKYVSSYPPLCFWSWDATCSNLICSRQWLVYFSVIHICANNLRNSWKNQQTHQNILHTFNNDINTNNLHQVQYHGNLSQHFIKEKYQSVTAT